MVNTPPPLFIYNKYYISQDRIAFKGVLPLSCPRAFRLARNVSLRTVFVAFNFSECVLSGKGAYNETVIQK